MLDALKELLAAGRMAEALMVVEKLVARNAELERQLRAARTSDRKNEGVSSAQLRLLLDGLPANTDGDRATADARLQRWSRINERDEEPDKEKRERRPRGRTAAGAPAPHRQSDSGAAGAAGLPELRRRAEVHRA